MGAASNRPSAGPRGPGPRTSVLIVTEVKILGEGLTEALRRDGSLSVLGNCDNALEALARVVSLLPDIMLLDAAVCDGLLLASEMPRIAPRVRLVVLALAETATSVITWAKMGVAGYIPKTAGLSDVPSILMEIMSGARPCSQPEAASVIERLRDLPLRNHTIHDTALTAREAQIVDLISGGLSNKEIARRLNIGEATTKSHVHNLLGKLGLQRRGQAAVWARDHLRPAAPRLPDFKRIGQPPA